MPWAEKSREHSEKFSPEAVKQCVVGREKQQVPKLECDGFELMMSSAWYSHIDRVIDDIKSYKLSIPVVHSQKSLGESMSGMTAGYSGGRYNEYAMTEEEDRKNFEDGTSRFAANLRLAEGVGAKKMVLHLWNGVVSDKNNNHTT